MDSDDDVEVATSVVASTVPPAVAAPLVLPGLPPAAVEALRSPPAGRYVYNCPVYISNSPLAMPSTLQRVLNFEPVEFTLPAALLDAPSFTLPRPPSPHTPPRCPTSPPSPHTPPRCPTSPYSPHTPPRPPTSPPTPVPLPTEIVMPLADARPVDLLAITNAFEPRFKEEFDSEVTVSSDTSYTLGSDSAYSGDWVEYKAGVRAGMDLDDPFLDDSDVFGAI